MDVTPFVRALRRNAGVLAAIVDDVDDGLARWKPEPDRWSILEVVCHLADEESRDFRTRVDLTLHRPGEAWPAIDPVRWATDERYAERVLQDETRRFLDERRKSVAWLEDLTEPDWSRSYEHPAMGTLRASDLMASWVAHDLIHIRQINRLHRQYLEAVEAPGARLGYAGPW